MKGLTGDTLFELPHQKPPESKPASTHKEEQSHPRLKRANRNQFILKTVNVEELVEEDHPVRAIWEFVGQLDLEVFYQDIKVKDGYAGRSAIDPQVLICLWIYAYSQGVASAREIEHLLKYHPGYQWLTGMEIINHHTLSDFRIDHKEALDKLFTDVLGVLSAEELITLERVMHDGTKIKAQAGKNSFKKKDRIQAHLNMAHNHILHMGDPREEASKINKAKERASREKKEHLERALEELQKIRSTKPDLKDKEKVKVSTTDPESRIMKQSNGGFDASYNIQISTDAHKSIIVGIDATQDGYDYDQLVKATQRVKDNMKQSPQQMVADGGYTNQKNIIAMSEKGIDFIGPSTYDPAENSPAQSKKTGIDPAFYRDRFKYSQEHDTFICPANKVLKYSHKQTKHGACIYQYRARSKDCRICSFKEKCCPKNPSKGRCVSRTEHVRAITDFVLKMKTDKIKDIYKQRAPIAEFTNAWIKEKLRLRQFRLRGLTKVRMECLWASITYNIQQWIRLKWRIQPT